MNSTNGITLRIQQNDECSAGLLNRIPDRKDSPRNAERGEWLEAHLGADAEARLASREG
jgi:hypothetical protein